MGSLDGISWFNIANGAYHVEPGLSQSNTYNGAKFVAVYDAGLGSMGANIQSRYIRYNVTLRSDWGYLFEMRADGHVADNSVGAVPEPNSILLLALGLLVIAYKARTRFA